MSRNSIEIHQSMAPAPGPNDERNERGAALATALIVLSMLGVISMTVMAVVTHEVRIAGSDLRRTQTFYAAASSGEKMTADFCALFATTSNPTTAQLNNIATSYPTELTGEGFSFNQSLAVDATALAAMGGNNTVTIPSGPFSGLVASVTPYAVTATATQNLTGAQVSLTRTINNYLIPIFQFGMFSNEDLEVYPGPAFTFNGRVHANGNLYISGNMTFLSKLSTANELVTDVVRDGNTHAQSMSVTVGNISVPLTMGSVVNGPNLSGAVSGQRGFFPGSPNGTINPSWNTTSVAAATTGVSNQFGGQVITRTTGGAPLLLPMQLEGNTTREIIKRRMPNDSSMLSQSRYHSKAEIRILLDDENPATPDASGIPSGQGVALSTFNPIPLPNVAVGSGGGRALWRVKDDGTYNEVTSGTKTYPSQQNGGSPTQALTVRSARATTQSVTLNGTSTKIPAGAGLSGRILIQIVDTNGNIYDVTQQILSMGITEGEPNSIVALQRPLWAAFVQGSRDSSGGSNPALNGDPAYSNTLVDILTNTHIGADGEIKTSTGPSQDGTYGFLTGVVDDTASGSQPQRSDTPPSNSLATLLADWGTGNWASHNDWNAMVPINVYNVREGYLNSGMTANAVYERGITSVVEINMRTLARWVDGVYDTNLLAGTNAVSANIASPDGYTVYVSDRRGDKVKSLVDSSGATINSTNGMVDNEDVYGPDGTLDPGEDVQATAALIKDTTEMPDPAVLAGAYGTDINKRAITVAAWSNPSNYFRRSVRVFNGENLQITGASGKLSTTKGITISSENMVYVWGNYNTTGINAAPPDGTAALNDSSKPYYYLGNQVPSSIVSDALFSLSKTFCDANTSMYPDDLSKRQADLNLPNVGAETSMRAAILSGNNLSALAGAPDAGNTPTGESRLNGGMHNFPRFLEGWNSQRCNFVGSFIPLYHSTQALGPYNADSTIYYPPTRDWAFDDTFKDPTRLPPGTPLFQYIEPTGFKQVL